MAVRRPQLTAHSNTVRIVVLSHAVLTRVPTDSPKGPRPTASIQKPHLQVAVLTLLIAALLLLPLPLATTRAKTTLKFVGNIAIFRPR